MNRRTNAFLIPVILASWLGSPCALGQKVYWTSERDGFDVKRANLDGSAIEGVVPNELLSRPMGIALDLTAAKMYWADNFNGKIQRADLDGQNIEDVTESGSGLPMAIALDLGVHPIPGGKSLTLEPSCRSVDGP